MYSVLVHASDPYGLLLAKLADLQTNGIVEEAGGWRAYFEDEDSIRLFAAEHPDKVVDLRLEQESENWPLTSNWDPVEVGSRFWIVPPGNTAPEPAGRFRLALETEYTFGTGRHESTQLMISALERVLQPGQQVLDIGCGSGILSLAAKMLGAGPVIACDLDLIAASEAARRNIDVFQGSVDAIRVSAADVVLANLTAPILDSISDRLPKLVAPDGLLLISGFLTGLVPKNYTPKKSFSLNSWECWICELR